MIAPGTRIGGLLIEGLLGRGAMGEVYQAQQVSLKRPVAVKRIAGHLVGDPDMVARFEREAQCIARIQSTNVVAVYEFGEYADEQGAKHFLLVMELVEGGRSLKSYMHGAMDWRIASSVILQAAEGLAAAAEHGVVHRDIKPDNLMITKKGVAKLTDFGLAKAVDSTSMTMGGTLLGTPAYMPPEACRGEPTDHRGDLYSLGATWYHLLSGHVPFQSENTMAMLRAHIEDPPPDILTLFPTVPEPIADLVRRCLAKDPAQRPASAQQMANELQALVAQGLHVKRSVPELVGAERAPVGDPSTIATLVDGGKANATTATAVPDAQAASAASSSAARSGPGTRDNQATIAQSPPPAAASRVSPLVIIIPAAVIAVAIAGFVWAIQHLRAPRQQAATQAAESMAVPTVPPAIPTKQDAHVGDAAPAATATSRSDGPATAAPKPSEPITSPAIASTSPKAVTQPVSADHAPQAAQPLPVNPPADPHPQPTAPVVVADLRHDAPPPIAPVAVVPTTPATPPSPASGPLPLPPPPNLTAPVAPRASSTAASDADAAVAAFRSALRGKRALEAGAVLSSLPADAGGYKDMVLKLGALKAAQDGAFAQLLRTAASGRIAEYAGAADRAAEFPELAPAVAQSRAYIAAIEAQWLAALKGVDAALARHDGAAARSALAQVPSDPAIVTPVVAARRNIAATAVAADTH